jgi:hypothetical protein
MMGHAILHFLWAQMWGAILVIAFIGWGHLALKCLTGQASSVGLSACAGLSMALFLGGLLNLLHLITGGVLICLTLAGVGLAIGRIIRPTGKSPMPEAAAVLPAWRGAWSWQRLALLCFVLLLLFRIASTPRVVAYVQTDDSQFYLAAPVKMMNERYLAADPYSERRVEGSVGGNYFLQGLVISFLPLQNIQMADQYVGLVLIVLVSFALARQFELSPLKTAILGIFSISLPPTNLNLTFNVLPSALFLAMVLIGTQRAYLTQRPAVQAFLVGALAGTVCSLKSTYLPHAVLFCLALYLLWGFEKGWRFAFMGWAFALMGALLVLVPWMAEMRVTSGTYFYPVLGTGYSFTSYHQFPAPYRAGLAQVFSEGAVYFLPLTAIIFAQIFLIRREERSLVFLAMTMACLLGTLATDIATGGESVRRYNFPVVMPVLLLTYLQFSWQRRLRPRWKPGRALQAGGIAMLMLAMALTEYEVQDSRYSNMFNRIRASLTDPPLDTPETRQEYAKISSALPKDGLILTTLQNPYLLDPLDRRVLLADWPGCASLPPGWPIKEDGEALAEYLLSHSIRYLAYTYTGNVQLSDCLRVSTNPVHRSGWLTVEYESYLLANKQYLELGQSRRKIYDDGKVFILDLSIRAVPPALKDRYSILK